MGPGSYSLLLLISVGLAWATEEHYLYTENANRGNYHDHDSAYTADATSRCSTGDREGLLSCAQTLTSDLILVLELAGEDTGHVMDAVCRTLAKTKTCVLREGRGSRCFEGGLTYADKVTTFVCDTARQEYKELFECVARLSHYHVQDLVDRWVQNIPAFRRRAKTFKGDGVILLQQILNEDLGKLVSITDASVFKLFCHFMNVWQTAAVPIMEGECGPRSTDFMKVTMHYVQPSADLRSGFIDSLEQDCMHIESQTTEEYGSTNDFSEEFDPREYSMIGLGARYIQYRKGMGLEECSSLRKAITLTHCFIEFVGGSMHRLTPDASQWSVDYFTQLLCARSISDLKKCLAEHKTETDCPTELELVPVLKATCLFLNTKCSEGDSAIIIPVDSSHCQYSKLSIIKSIMGRQKTASEGTGILTDNWKIVHDSYQCSLDANARHTEDYTRLCGNDSGAAHDKMLTQWRKLLDKLPEFIEKFIEEASVFSPLFGPMLKMYLF